MKRILILATALFLVSGVSFADNNKKKKKAKAKKSCCKKDESGCGKSKSSTVAL